MGKRNAGPSVLFLIQFLHHIPLQAGNNWKYYYQFSSLIPYFQ